MVYLTKSGQTVICDDFKSSINLKHLRIVHHGKNPSRYEVVQQSFGTQQDTVWLDDPISG